MHSIQLYMCIRFTSLVLMNKLAPRYRFTFCFVRARQLQKRMYLRLIKEKNRYIYKESGALYCVVYANALQCRPRDLNNFCLETLCEETFHSIYSFSAQVFLDAGGRGAYKRYNVFKLMILFCALVLTGCISTNCIYEKFYRACKFKYIVS